MVPHLGCRGIRQLLNIVDTPEAVFEMSHADRKKLFGNHEAIISAIEDPTTLQKAQNELDYCEQEHIRALAYTDSAFPQRLNKVDCDDTPTVLYYLGNADLNPPRSVCIVGTRRATEYGREQVEKLVAGMCQEQVLVVSGLALGVDSTAHRAALSNGLPTVAVVAHGLEQIYPPQNRELARRIVRTGGGIVTEYAHGTRINPGFFPARNRIIAAMADGTVVAEADVKGGALITANLAYSYHRDVMALPGRIGDKYSAGCNRMIASSKAQLIENSDDLFATLNWQRLHNLQGTGLQTVLPLNLPPDEQALFDLLNKTGETLLVDDLVQKSDFSLPQVTTLLLSMELKNLVKALPGNRYKLL